MKSTVKQIKQSIHRRQKSIKAKLQKSGTNKSITQTMVDDYDEQSIVDKMINKLPIYQAKQECFENSKSDSYEAFKPKWRNTIEIPWIKRTRESKLYINLYYMISIFLWIVGV